MTNRRMSQQSGITPDLLDQQYARFIDWARERTTRPAGRFYAPEVVKDFGVGARTASRLLRRAMDEEVILDMGERNGYAAVGVAAGRVTLADLVADAASIVAAAGTLKESPRSGRRGFSEERDYTAITTAQFERIRALAGDIAAYIAGDRRALDQVADPVLWQWDEEEEEWNLKALVRRWAREQGWGSASNKIAAATVMLDVAATDRGPGTRAPLLRRDRRPFAAVPDYHAAEWEPWVRRWSERVVRRNSGKNRRKVLQGARTLALYATRRGELRPHDVDWCAVRDAIQADRLAETITHDTWNWARFVYRSVRVLRRFVPGSEWPRFQDRRMGLVPNDAVSDPNRWTCRGTFRLDGDGRALLGDDGWPIWQAIDTGRFPRQLADSPYGLRAWYRWATAQSATELTMAGLPPREWPNPTEAQRLKIVKDPNFLKLQEKVALERQAGFLLVAGWAEQHRYYDWETQDLTSLVDPKLVLEWGRATAKKPTSSSLVSRVCFDLATLASPFLEAVAIRRGKPELAAELRAASAALKVQGVEWKDEDGPKNIQNIEAAWDAGANKGGWKRLMLLRNLHIADAVRRAGGLTLEEQVAHVAAGGDTWGERWAVAVRMAVLLTVVRRVPLRVRAISGLTMDMWLAHPAGEWGQSRAVQPWEGALQLSVPADLTKSKKPYRPFLMPRGAVGVPYREIDLNRALLQLYFMPGGARDEVLSVCEYGYRDNRRIAVSRTVHLSPYVFPALARRGARSADARRRLSSGCQWEEGALSEHFGDLVIRHAATVGMNADVLENEWGAVSIHVIRLLFGTYWAGRKKMLAWASKMLHHASPAITAQRYCGDSPETIDLDDGEEDEVVRPRAMRAVDHGDSGQSLQARAVRDALAGLTAQLEAGSLDVRGFLAKVTRLQVELG